MPFHFPLESLLAYRRNCEKKCENALRHASAKASRLGHEIENSDRARIQLSQAEAVLFNSGIRASELHWNALWRAALGTHRQRLEKRLKEMECERQLCRQNFLQAKQQREMVERLREQHWNAYRTQAERRSQQHLDDFYLLRKAYFNRSILPPSDI